MKTTKVPHPSSFQLRRRDKDGSVMIITLSAIAILLLVVAITLRSSTNKYLTAYQWASWQEALQGAESGADMAMAELRNDVQKKPAAWAGWMAGKYTFVNGVKTTVKEDKLNWVTIGSDGNVTISNNSGSGGSTTSVLFNITNWLDPTKNITYDFVTYKTDLSAHSGEGNTRLTVTTTVDAPASLKIAGGRQWLRVRATGTTDVSGPNRVSEEKLDNRLRKLSLIYDKLLGGTLVENKPVATRQIELVAKPVSLFAGALMAMVEIKNDKKAGIGGIVTDSFNSEGYYNAAQGKIVDWPINSSTLEFDLTMSHDPSTAIGKNGDIGSNAFPIKHDKSETMDITSNVIWGDVGNNYTQIKGVDPAYYNTSYDPNNPTYGLNNGGFAVTNPNTKLIQANGDGDVSGDISTNFYRDLPPITDPTWTTSDPNIPDYRTKITVVDKDNNANVENLSTDSTKATRIKVSSISLKGKDKWNLKATTSTKKVNGVDVTTVTPTYVEVWVTGDITLDDGGAVVVENGVNARVYFDRNIKIGQNLKDGVPSETKTNGGGFDNQSDDAKSLLLLGVTEPDSTRKLLKDGYTDPLGNYSEYTSYAYKATGNVSFFENDFTGAIYAPDHNIIFGNSKDGKGKRKKRTQTGIDMYGSFVGRTINTQGPHNFHFDESLNDAGPVRDWGYVSWFEDVDVDKR